MHHPSPFSKILRKISAIFRYGIHPIVHRWRLQAHRVQQAPIFHDRPTFSQNGQDHYLASTILADKRSGFFVDIGAHDGETGSNSLFFEREMGWTGVCFEPNPIPFEILKTRRNCISVNACIGAHPGHTTFTAVQGPCEQLSGISEFFSPWHRARIEDCIMENGGALLEKQVPIVNLQNYCQEHQISTIDLLCIDVEGAEMVILESISFEHLNIRTIIVENNYHADQPVGFLSKKGFVLVAMVGCDEIYTRDTLKH